MLASLTIQNLVLIDRLTIAFEFGFTAVTGETGAGKSVILNAVSLAAGGRGGKELVRKGADQAVVIAAFEITDDAPVAAFLAEHGIDHDDQLFVRRIISKDGKSRCFVNDQPVTLALLRALVSPLIEIHGQDDGQTLRAARGQRDLLDAFEENLTALTKTRATYQHWQNVKEQHKQLQDRVRHAAEDESYLRHQLDELASIAVLDGEEALLADRRSEMMHAEKLSDEFSQIRAMTDAEDGIANQLSKGIRRLQRLLPLAEQKVEPIMAAMERALVEIGEMEAALDDALGTIERAPTALEEVERRLFSLRDAARKHRVQVAELPALLAQTEEQIAAIENSAEQVDGLASKVADAFADYIACATKLSTWRKTNARSLEQRINADLPDLKLDKARFQVSIRSVEAEAGGPHGLDSVSFEVSINPGQPFTPLERTASGGERARILLALKAALGKASGYSTMIFDEIDTGLGGAVADAVGERLSRLSQSHQVVSITHAPQVAARATQHFRVRKTGDAVSSAISLDRLDDRGRRDEIARMLAGAKITAAAKAAADSLLELVHAR